MLGHRLRRVERAMGGAAEAELRRMCARVAARRGMGPQETAEVVTEAVRLLREAQAAGDRDLSGMLARIAAEDGIDPAVLLAEAEAELAAWDADVGG